MRGVAAAALVLAVAAAGLAGPVARVERQGVELVLSVDKDAYARGEPVQMELVVHNPGPGAVTFQFSDSQRYDFVVQDDRGAVVWYWSRDKMFAQVLGSLTLMPGEERRFRERWDQRDLEGRAVPAGRYWIVGLFPPQRPILPELAGVRGPRVGVDIGLPSRSAVSAYHKVFRPGRVRVRFFPWAAEREVRRLLRALDLRVERTGPSGFWVVRTREADETWEVAQALNRSPLVEWAVPDYVLVPRR
ncbi:MAG: BsuPI-related putative proteinase inhibitor [Armatimonadota bacterium]|nr:BsuPI-related putative proteinase inhibitor [Armatimonadota bacterium]MDR7408496.1 BsuPI-related putative proteinase inhibitor [Armatimonadota bacterium]MDR7410270.1 BsuPI-related putative proteinase inhibitor [Armatimonadota bacterium]